MDNIELMKTAIKKGLKILHVDIETSPPLVMTYGLKDTYIGQNQIIIPTQITSLSYMSETIRECFSLEWDWLGDIIITPTEVKGGGCDKQMLENFVEIANEADLVIGQNSDSFDLKILQWRLNFHKLPPIKNAITLDTLKLSRKVFRPDSHKLDYRSRTYGYGGKIKQDMDDCMDVARGNEVKQALRVKYNIKDTVDTRKVFWRELPYYILPVGITKMLANYITEKKIFCLHCSSKHRSKFDIKETVVNNKLYYQCNNCDAKWSRK